MRYKALGDGSVGDDAGELLEQALRQCVSCTCRVNASRVTRHASHVARHTSHVTRNTWALFTMQHHQKHVAPCDNLRVRIVQQRAAALAARQPTQQLKQTTTTRQLHTAATAPSHLQPRSPDALGAGAAAQHVDEGERGGGGRGASNSSDACNGRGEGR